jgi:hypothetical protein
MVEIDPERSFRLATLPGGLVGLAALPVEFGCTQSRYAGVGLQTGRVEPSLGDNGSPGAIGGRKHCIIAGLIAPYQGAARNCERALIPLHIAARRA